MFFIKLSSGGLSIFTLMAFGTGSSLCQPSTNTNILEMNAKLLARQRETPAYGQIPKISKVPAAPQFEQKKLSEKVVFLTDGATTVVLPKGAIIYMPSKGRLSIHSGVKGKLVEWEEFFLANRNAVLLEQVDLQQIQGIKPLAPSVIERVRKGGIATFTSYQGRIVSLLPAL